MAKSKGSNIRVWFKKCSNLILQDISADTLNPTLIHSAFVNSTLSAIVSSLLCENSNVERQRVDKWILQLFSILQLSDDKILSYNYKDVPTYWRRVYTDSTLILQFCRYLSLTMDDDTMDDDKDQKQKSRTMVLDGVRMLDMSLIVAGAPGRREIVWEFIEMLQKLIIVSSSSSSQTLTSSITPPSHSDVRPLKRPRLDGTSSQFQLYKIPENDPPPFSYFHASRPRPVLLRSFISDWPAVQRWNSNAYLLSLTGPGRVVPVELGGDYTRDGWGQAIVPWNSFLSQRFEEIERPMYLAQHDLFKQFPKLLNDIILPDYLYAAPEEGRNEEYKEYKSPNNEDGFILNAWIGGGGNKSPAHTDPYWNCYAQVVGRKSVWIAPPTLSHEMYPFSGRPSDNYTNDTDQDDDPSHASYLTNTSRLDVFDLSRKSTETHKIAPEDLEKYPKFFEKALPVSMQATLEPGDMLILPPGWWHAMRVEEWGASVSMWF